jgi:integrase
MATHKRTDTEIKRAIKSGEKPKIGDGAGLWLQIPKPGIGSWIFRFTRDGRSREMGLGSYPSISLQKARELAGKAKEAVSLGGDPIDTRRSLARPVALTTTFAAAADQYITAKQSGWSNAKHREQWKTTLEQYANPTLGSMALAEITRDDVLAVVEPIWHEKYSTASRVRGRIEKILDWGAAKGLRTGDNPARWETLQHSLSERSEAVQHHPSLPYKEVPAFIAALPPSTTSAGALKFLILTAMRSGAVLGARWEEFNDEMTCWTVPAKRMKGKGIRRKEHRVPLTTAAIGVLDEMGEKYGRDGTVFKGQGGREKHLSTNALEKTMTRLLIRMGAGHAVPHGFRTSFRDWAGEVAKAPWEVAEISLAHVIGSKSSQAYFRTDLLEQRRELMKAWAQFCCPDSPLR